MNDKKQAAVLRERYPGSPPRLPDEFLLSYCAEDRDLAPGARYGPVIRSIYLVECCTAGKGSAIINGREFPVKAGDCYVILPGDTVIHTADTVCPREGLWCFLDGMRLEEMFFRAGIRHDQPYLPAAAYEGVKKTLARMLEVGKAADGGAYLRKSACVMELMGEILRFAPVQEDREESVAVALRRMEACYDQPLRVAELAKEAGLERCWFSTVFKQKTGLSPYEYLSRLRIRKACELIKSTHHPISLVAAAVGLDAENFARVFKKYTGMSPSRYRSQEKKS